jgi:hypothetical protein
VEGEVVVTEGNAAREIRVYTLEPCDDVDLLQESVAFFNESQQVFRAVWRGDAGLVRATSTPPPEAPPGEDGPTTVEGPPEASWNLDEVSAHLLAATPRESALLVLTSGLLSTGPVTTIAKRVTTISKRTTFVSTRGWTDDRQPPRVDTLIAWLLAGCAYRLTGGHLNEAQSDLHDSATGCLLDQGPEDADGSIGALKLALRCGWLCLRHRAHLAQFEPGCDEALDAIERVLERVRRRAAPSGSIARRRTRDGRVLFSWVHLSDIHVGHGDAGHAKDQSAVMETLHRELPSLTKKASLRPAAVLVTGDVAFSGASRSKDEYTSAATWLRGLARRLGLTERDVYVVPGNHDVQRHVDKDDNDVARLLRELRAGTGGIDDALRNVSDRKKLERRMANYLTFAEQFALVQGAAFGEEPSRLWWKTNFDLGRGVKVRIVGLNTALLAADENTFGNDAGQLSLGVHQLADAFTDVHEEVEPFILVMSHHPLSGGWLRDHDRARNWIHSRAQLHLTGHVHDSESSLSRRSGGTGLVTIAAGAVHEEAAGRGARARHGYNVAALMSDDERAWVRVWPRMWSEKRSGFRTDVELLDDGALHHDLDVDLPMLRGAGR